MFTSLIPSVLLGFFDKFRKLPASEKGEKAISKECESKEKNRLYLSVFESHPNEKRAADQIEEEGTIKIRGPATYECPSRLLDSQVPIDHSNERFDIRFAAIFTCQTFGKLCGEWETEAPFTGLTDSNGIFFRVVETFHNRIRWFIRGKPLPRYLCIVTIGTAIQAKYPIMNRIVAADPIKVVRM